MIIRKNWINLSESPCLPWKLNLIKYASKISYGHYGLSNQNIDTFNVLLLKNINVSNQNRYLCLEVLYLSYQEPQETTKLIVKQYQFYALISMLFAGLTSVVAKAGLKNVSADTGLAIRTSFVFAFIWINIFVFNQIKDFLNLTLKDVSFLGVSALTTTVSWIFYYKAIKIGQVSEVALIDKASIIITIILSFLFLQEQLTWKICIGAILILSGLITIVWK